MYKRMWKANRIFTFLFLLSFSLTFCIVYYGMFLKSQIEQMGNAVEKTDYEYRSWYSVAWAKDIHDRAQIKLPELKQGILLYAVLVHEKDIVGVKSASVVMEMNENLMEPLEHGTYFQQDKEYERPQCIVGDAWLLNAKKDGDTTLLNLNGYDCEVTGILKSNTFEGSDERIFLYGPSMPGEFLEKLILITQSMSVDYRISEHADSEQIKIYEDWIHSGIFENTEKEEFEDTYGSGILIYREVTPVYNKFFIAMVAFCFANCAFLTYVWCSKKVQENMLKRVFGFNVVRIWWDGVKEIALYEAVSVLISSMICMGIEACRDNALNFFVTWKYGVGIMGTVLFLFTFLLGMINIFYLEKLKPADVLKTTE